MSIRTGDAFRLAVALLFIALVFDSYIAGRLPARTDVLDSATTTCLEILATGFAFPTVIACEVPGQPYAVVPGGTVAFRDADFIETRATHEASRKILAGFGIIRVTETIPCAEECPPEPRQ